MIGRGLGQFDQLLVDLGARAARIRPIEPGSRGALLQLGSALQRRQRQRNPGQCALVGLNGAFLGLDLLPQVMTAMLGITEDMRMTTLELVANPPNDVVDSPGPSSSSAPTVSSSPAGATWSTARPR